MKISEIDWTDDKQYTDSRGLTWTVVSGDLFRNLNKKVPEVIYDEYPMCEILELNFEPVVDWSKVKVDTKVWVSNDEGVVWARRHFAKYEDGKVYVFDSGQTSWTTDKYSTWLTVTLAEESEGGAV